jgi:hypothetical protein
VSKLFLIARPREGLLHHTRKPEKKKVLQVYFRTNSKSEQDKGPNQGHMKKNARHIGSGSNCFFCVLLHNAFFFSVYHCYLALLLLIITHAFIVSALRAQNHKQQPELPKDSRRGWSF